MAFLVFILISFRFVCYQCSCFVLNSWLFVVVLFVALRFDARSFVRSFIRSFNLSGCAAMRCIRSDGSNSGIFLRRYWWIVVLFSPFVISNFVLAKRSKLLCLHSNDTSSTGKYPPATCIRECSKIWQCWLFDCVLLVQRFRFLCLINVFDFRVAAIRSWFMTTMRKRSIVFLSHVVCVFWLISCLCFLFLCRLSMLSNWRLGNGGAVYLFVAIFW